MLEFALIFPIALVLSLLIAQAAFLMAGNLCVHYAAFCAARAAVVQVPLALPPGSSPTDPSVEGPNRVLAPNQGNLNVPKDQLTKKQRIQMAALYALMPMSSDSEDLNNANIPLRNGLTQYFQSQNLPVPAWIDEKIGRKWTYAEMYTQVQLDPPVAGDTYAANEELVVNVTHTFYLGVPYANRIFALMPGGTQLQFGQAGREYGTVIKATCRLTNEGVQDFVDPNDWLRSRPLSQ